jgi:hypothetical protein
LGIRHPQDLLNQYGDEIRKKYWREVSPGWNRHTDAAINELIDRLLEAQRPRAALHVVHMDWSKIETSRLKRLLLAVATTNAEPAATFRLDRHDISDALESLNGRAEVTPEEMAQLEFLYISALYLSKHGIPNLERQIAQSPSFFVQALALLYERSDEGHDPPEWQINDADRREAVATSVHRLLDQAKRIPGTDPNGQISTEDLRGWVRDVRQFCAQDVPKSATIRSASFSRRRLQKTPALGRVARFAKLWKRSVPNEWRKDSSSVCATPGAYTRAQKAGGRNGTLLPNTGHGRNKRLLSTRSSNGYLKISRFPMIGKRKGTILKQT